MAEALPGILEPLNNFATSEGANYWLNLGINLILSTLVTGIVLILVLEAAKKAWGESVNVANAFMLVLAINLINIFGVIGFISPYLGSAALILPVIIWIVLVKAFFSGMGWKHAVAIGVAGYLLTIFVVPWLIALVSGFIPAPA